MPVGRFRYLTHLFNSLQLLVSGHGFVSPHISSRP
jgi:hypothetical protein